MTATITTHTNPTTGRWASVTLDALEPSSTLSIWAEHKSVILHVRLADGSSVQLQGDAGQVVTHWAKVREALPWAGAEDVSPTAEDVAAAILAGRAALAQTDAEVSP